MQFYLSGHVKKKKTFVELEIVACLTCFSSWVRRLDLRFFLEIVFLNLSWKGKAVVFLEHAPCPMLRFWIMFLLNFACPRTGYPHYTPF